MVTCPDCGSTRCSRFTPISQPPHRPHHAPHGGTSLLAIGIVLGVIGAANAYDNYQKSKKFHKVKYKCQNCDEIFKDWNVTDRVSFDWTIKNETPFTLSVSFFSQDRDVGWPSPDSYWSLVQDEKYTFSLNALKGERVCFAAWKKYYSFFDDPEWGVGRNNSNGCSNCCYIFNSSTGSGSTTLIYNR